MHICILKDEHREKAAFMVRNGLLREAFQGIARENIGIFALTSPHKGSLYKLGRSLPQKTNSWLGSHVEGTMLNLFACPCPYGAAGDRRLYSGSMLSLAHSVHFPGNLTLSCDHKDRLVTQSTFSSLSLPSGPEFPISVGHLCLTPTSNQSLITDHSTSRVFLETTRVSLPPVSSPLLT